MYFDSKQELLKFVRSYTTLFKFILFKRELNNIEANMSMYYNKIEYKYAGHIPIVITDRSNKTFINQPITLTPPKISIITSIKINSTSHTLNHFIWWIPMKEKNRNKCLLEYGFKDKKYNWVSNTEEKFITHRKIVYKTEV